LVILDTNVVSELTRLEPSRHVINWLDGQDEDDVFITAITKAEIIYGLEVMDAGRRRFQLEAKYRILFETRFLGRVLPFDGEAAHPFARFAASARKRGRTHSMGDLRIAAIASSNYASLATRNLDHFEHLGLELINPWAD
jgi:toxin FitB